MKKILILVLLTMATFIWLAIPIWAAPVPEDAQRHFNRGMAAVELAKSPEDYELAIREFQQAQMLAPDWPDAYYNLGLIQEKVGQFEEAAISLRSYLHLEPDSPDAAAIRVLIDKAEFKAEQVITDEDVLNILVSLSNKNQWQLKGLTNANLLRQDWIRSFSRSSTPGYNNRLIFKFYSGSCCPTLQGLCPGDVLPEGKTVELQTFYCAGEDGGYLSVFNYRLEVVSRDKVKMDLTVKSPKEWGGGTEDASFEFIRR